MTILAKTKDFKATKVVDGLSMKQKADNKKCIVAMMKKQGFQPKADWKERAKHAKKFLRHTNEAKSLVQEAGPYFFDHGSFKHGYLSLAQCMDVCISAHCPCPGPTGDFMSRYPDGVDAEAAGVPSADDAAETQEEVAELTENLNSDSG